MDKPNSVRDRDGEHYGYYGTACAKTGQLSAGLCWKCQIKKLTHKLVYTQGCLDGFIARLTKIVETMDCEEWCGKSPTRDYDGKCPACKIKMLLEWKDE